MDQLSQAEKKLGTKARTQGMSCRNYHCCLRPILQGLEGVTKDGFVCYLTIGKQARLVCIIVRVAIFMGDGRVGTRFAAALHIISNPEFVVDVTPHIINSLFLETHSVNGCSRRNRGSFSVTVKNLGKKTTSNCSLG